MPPHHLLAFLLPLLLSPLPPPSLAHPLSPLPAPQYPLPLTLPHTRNLGAVASESLNCTNIGLSLLRAGGSAADALVGTVFCVGVVDAHHSGIGGGGFALARGGDGGLDRGREVGGRIGGEGRAGGGEGFEVVDFREMAPEGAWEEMFEGNVGGSLFGGLASATPGEARGLEYIHRKYGRLPWKTVLQPAVALARDGFRVSDDFAMAMEFSTRDYDFLSLDPEWAIDFAPNGTRVGRGDMMTRKRYAKTLEAIAESGADAFYAGEIAEATIRAVRKSGGMMTRRDLEGYTIVSRRPVEIEYKGYHVHGCGAPASAAVALSALKILEAYGDMGDEMGNLATHRMTEAMKFGYGKRASMGDPDFVEGLHEFEQEMLSEEFARMTRAKISDRHTLNVSAYDPEGFESLEDHGTSHIVTADASGMAFSLTTTINLFFGSRVMVPETGVILNNEMNDFSIPNVSNVFGYYPSPANYVLPFKRPLSSIAPIITTHANNNSLHLVIGASGGSRIITTTLQNSLHVLSSNMSLAKALRQPRLHDQLIPDVVVFEEGYDGETVEYMKGRGHNVTWGPAGSSAQALRVLGDGGFEAQGEPRQRDSGGGSV